MFENSYLDVILDFLESSVSGLYGKLQESKDIQYLYKNRKTIHLILIVILITRSTFKKYYLKQENNVESLEFKILSYFISIILISKSILK